LLRNRFTLEAQAQGESVFDLLNAIADARTGPAVYRNAMIELGRLLGASLAHEHPLRDRIVCVAFTVEDADYLARGLIESLEAAGAKVMLACFWNRRDKPFDVDWLDIATIVQEYVEPLPAKIDHLVVLKSIISGACVVRTNLLRLLHSAMPEVIHIVAPVMLTGAEQRLARELPPDLVSRFEFLAFAVDTEKTNDGNVVPGIGGEIYERLGLGDEIEKNRVMPRLVEERVSAAIS
jgi:hypothetical protein